MFNGCSQLLNLDLTNFNTSEVTDMSYMFQGCGNSSSLMTLDLSSFDTAKVTTMQQMFQSSNIANIDLMSFSSDNLRSMRNMFASSKATSIQFSPSFTAEKVYDMTSAFLSCSKLTSLDLSYFKPQSLTLMQNTFNGTALTELDLSGFHTQKVSTMQAIFSGSKSLKTIYVGDGWILSTKVTDINMFLNCNALVGGNGTTYNASFVDKTYARIDGGTENPGYFTDIADKPAA